MRIEILDQAIEDLIEGFHFYEVQQAGLGSCFLTNLAGDIESLQLYGGIHRKAYKELSPPLVQAIPIRSFCTPSKIKPSQSVLSWIAVGTLPGFVGDWADRCSAFALIGVQLAKVQRAAWNKQATRVIHADLALRLSVA